MLGVDGPGGRAVCLVRFNGRVTAFADECSHQAFPLSAGDVARRHQCVWHGARFDCATGDVRRGPATETFRHFAVRVEGHRVLVGPVEAGA